MRSCNSGMRLNCPILARALTAALRPPPTITTGCFGCLSLKARRPVRHGCCGVLAVSSVLEVPTQLALAILLAVSPAPGEPEPAMPGGTHTVTAASRLDLGYSDATWLRLVQAHGAAAGLDDLARRIFRTSSGRIYVPVDADRQAVLALKQDPAIAPRIATEAARANARQLQRALGRPTTSGELLLAHRLGLQTATDLLVSAAREPQRPASEVAPAAALADPAAFFQDVRPRSSAGVVRIFTSAMERAAAARNAAAAGASSPAWATAVVPATATRQTATATAD